MAKIEFYGLVFLLHFFMIFPEARLFPIRNGAHSDEDPVSFTTLMAKFFKHHLTRNTPNQIRNKQPMIAIMSSTNLSRQRNSKSYDDGNNAVTEKVTSMRTKVIKNDRQAIPRNYLTHRLE